jgi:hypothetical protein
VTQGRPERAARCPRPGLPARTARVRREPP